MFCTLDADYAPAGLARIEAVRAGAVWRRAIEVPGLGALNVRGYAEVVSVSCSSAGNCAADGFYQDSKIRDQAFVVSQRNGHWGRAIEVPGTAALNVGGRAQVNSVSCTSAGYCAAGGFYRDRTSGAHRQGFVVSRS